MENYYKLEEARNILKISDATIRRYIRSGKLKYQMLGREYRIPESALEELLVEKTATEATKLLFDEQPLIVSRHC